MALESNVTNDKIDEIKWIWFFPGIKPEITANIDAIIGNLNEIIKQLIIGYGDVGDSVILVT